MNPGIINSKNKASGSGFDDDAQLYIDNAGVTDQTEKDAANQIFLDIKDGGYYSKMKALYLFLGGTADTCKYNAVNPLDTNAAYRLTWDIDETSTYWTWNSSGAIATTIGLANTWINPSTVLTDTSAGMTIARSAQSTNNGYNMGLSAGGNQFVIIGRTTLAGGRAYSATLFTASTGIKIGVISLNRIGTGVEVHQNSASIKTGTGTGTLPDGFININGLSLPGEAATYVTSAIHDGLTASETVDFQDAISTFNDTLGRKTW